jgi:hypothetical protein
MSAADALKAYNRVAELAFTPKRHMTHLDSSSNSVLSFPPQEI